MCVFSALPLSACQDTDFDLITAIAPEAHGAVALTGGLPSLPDLVEAQGLNEESRSVVEAWWDSWALSQAEGSLVREGLYPAVAARLFPLLSHGGVRDLLVRNERSLRTVRELGGVMDDKGVEAAFQAALQFHDRAWMFLENGSGEGALTFALRSADALRSVSPAQVASGLLDRARVSLRRIEDIPTYSQEELARIRRLTSGAEEAFADGDYPRAIRRAYYACQLLGVGTG